MKLIQRHGYIEFLRRNRERSIIKVVSGIRRCRRSGALRQVCRSGDSDRRRRLPDHETE